MKIIDLYGLKEEIFSLCEVKNPKSVNKDMLWKNGVMLKYVNENNLYPKRVLDIGAGCANFPLYLIKKYDIEYFAVDHAESVDSEFLDRVKLNECSIDRVKYIIQDFLDFKPEGKFDLILDICSVTHFRTSQDICSNDGVYLSGLSILNSLTEDGIFLCVSDCIDEKIANHRGEINNEYISVEQMIDCYSRSGLKLKGEPWFLSSDDINNFNIDKIGVDKIERSYSRFDYGHRDHYDRVLLAFSKK